MLSGKFTLFAENGTPLRYNFHNAWPARWSGPQIKTDSDNTSEVKMPGMRKFGSVTLKRGIFSVVPLATLKTVAATGGGIDVICTKGAAFTMFPVLGRAYQRALFELPLTAGGGGAQKWELERVKVTSYSFHGSASDSDVATETITIRVEVFERA